MMSIKDTLLVMVVLTIGGILFGLFICSIGNICVSETIAWRDVVIAIVTGMGMTSLNKKFFNEN